MRRSNGFAALHDLCSGTRVIVRPTATHRPLLLKPPEPSEEIKPAALTIGPYHVLADLGSTLGGEWRLGYDVRLFRKVWLCVVPAGTPRMAAVRQNLTLAGRLRWLAGRRGPLENWDAFEAPTGQALWQLLDRCHDWGNVGYWLLDLSEELACALKDGTLPPTLGLESVWITADGRAMLLDQGVPGLEVAAGASIATQPGDVEPVKGFLQQVAVAALSGRRVGFGEAQVDTFALPLPLYVRPIVEGLKKVQRPEVAAAQIQGVLGKPTRVTKTRRAALVACCVGIPLLMTVFSFGVMALATSTTGATPELIDLQNALQLHSPPIAWPTQSSPEMKTALETYLAGTHRELINDPATWTNGYMTWHVSPQQRIAAKEIIARTPPPTEQELQRARALVGPSLDAMKDHGGLDSSTLPLFLPFMFIMTLVMYIAIPSVLCALVFRGGLLWWTFGLAAVTKNGQPAGRWRLSRRNSMAWSPLLLFPIALAIEVLLVDEHAGTREFLAITFAAMALASIAYAALVLASTFASLRGWPDRLAGTWLVIR